MELPDKKRRIMEAAERLCRTRQFHELTLDEVAKEADVGKGTLYLYFTDKDDIFYQTAVFGFDELCAALESSLVAGASVRGELRRALVCLDGFFSGRQPLFMIILFGGGGAVGRGGELQRMWLEHRKRMTGILVGLLGRGVAAGELRSDFPPAAMAECLLGMFRARLAGLLEGHDSLDALLDLFLGGAAARGGPV